jgi:hypothetical protein
MSGLRIKWIKGVSGGLRRVKSGVRESDVRMRGRENSLRRSEIKMGVMWAIMN